MSAREVNVERWAMRYARIALGGAFLSGIADRFGLWGKTIGYGDFAHFVLYTAQVNSFMPPSTSPGPHRLRCLDRNIEGETPHTRLKELVKWL